jgi:hypothetical protein
MQIQGNLAGHKGGVYAWVQAIESHKASVTVSYSQQIEVNRRVLAMHQSLLSKEVGLFLTGRQKFCQ